MSGRDFLDITEIAAWYYIPVACIASVGVALLRWYVSGGVCHSKARLDGKFVIVTGANTGIGKETAKDLALRGARVVLATRDPLKGAEAAGDIYKATGKSFGVKTLDLSDLDSVRQFAVFFLEKEPKLDLLVLNAGVMMCPKLLSKQGYELQFATNHLGHFLLTSLLLPLLQKSSPSRIVVVSSNTHKRTKINFNDINSTKYYSPYIAYAQSKLANILFSCELAKRLKGVTVNCLHPGLTSSDLGRHIENKCPWMQRLVIKPVQFLVKFLAFKTVQQGAQTSIYCAVSEELEGVTGKYFSDCAVTELLPQATDENAARRLWDLSEVMVGLKTGADNSNEIIRENLNGDNLKQKYVRNFRATLTLTQRLKCLFDMFNKPILQV